MDPITAHVGPWTFAPEIIMADSRVTNAAFRVYCAIAKRTRIRLNRMAAYPGHKRIATDAAVSQHTVIRATTLLAKLGYIEIINQFRDRRQVCNQYVICCIAPEGGGDKIAPPGGGKLEYKAYNYVEAESCAPAAHSADALREVVTSYDEGGSEGPPDNPPKRKSRNGETLAAAAPSKRKSKRGENLRRGAVLAGLWDRHVAGIFGIPRVADMQAKALAAADKRFRSLLLTPQFAELTPQTVMDAIAAQVPKVSAFHMQHVTFEVLFVRQNTNLACLLSGQWNDSADDGFGEAVGGMEAIREGDEWLHGKGK